MKNFVCDGKKIEATLAADTTSGTVLKVGSLIVVTAVGGKTNDKVVCERSGCYSVPKKSADAFTQGASVYWDNAAKEMTLTSSANTLAGYAYEDVAGGVTTAKVILLG